MTLTRADVDYKNFNISPKLTYHLIFVHLITQRLCVGQCKDNVNTEQITEINKTTLVK